MGRKFVRASLGGVRDEAEIRGHRRTYVGAMPGRILQSLRRAGSRNPVFLLDEIDKLGADFRGDPSSALLEVLDPEQNATLQRSLPRGAVRPLAGDLHRHGEHARDDPARAARPHGGDRAAGLHRARQARDRARATWCRSSSRRTASRAEQVDAHRRRDRQRGARVHARGRRAQPRPPHREPHAQGRAPASRRAARRRACRARDRRRLRRRRRSARRRTCPRRAERTDACPASWSGSPRTAHGGDILFIEATVLPGGEGVRLRLTGPARRRDARVRRGRALVGARERRALRRSAATSLAGGEIHLHVPAGAVPKDGPSAGVALATAIVSALSGRRARGELAMTGEISLRGRVLPVGGIKDKVLAASRAGIAPRAAAAPQREGPGRRAGRGAREARHPRSSTPSTRCSSRRSSRRPSDRTRAQRGFDS